MPTMISDCFPPAAAASGSMSAAAQSHIRMRMSVFMIDLLKGESFESAEVATDTCIPSQAVRQHSSKLAGAHGPLGAQGDRPPHECRRPGDDRPGLLVPRTQS